MLTKLNAFFIMNIIHNFNGNEEEEAKIANVFVFRGYFMTTSLKKVLKTFREHCLFFVII